MSPDVRQKEFEKNHREKGGKWIESQFKKKENLVVLPLRGREKASEDESRLERTKIIFSSILSPLKYNNSLK